MKKGKQSNAERRSGLALMVVVPALLLIGLLGIASDCVGWEWAASRCEHLFKEIRNESGV